MSKLVMLASVNEPDKFFVTFQGGRIIWSDDPQQANKLSKYQAKRLQRILPVETIKIKYDDITINKKGI